MTLEALGRLSRKPPQGIRQKREKVPEVIIFFDSEGGEVGFEERVFPHQRKLRFHTPRGETIHSRRRK